MREPVVEVRCARCGWEGRWHELDVARYEDDLVDVTYWRCPRCGAVEYDGMEVFEEVF